MNDSTPDHEPNSSEKALVFLLRGSGVILMTALLPVVMPFTWMQEIYRQLGMGELPNLPITGYLTRSLSAMYALHGAITFYVSLDIRRFLPVVKCLAGLGISFGLLMLVLDWSVEMPLAWTLGEGPFVIILGAAILWLARGVVDQRL